MSAFLCSAKHISGIVNAVSFVKRGDEKDRYIERALPPDVAAQVASYDSPLSHEDALFNLLFEENMRSLGYRYPEESKVTDWTTETITYIRSAKCPSVVAALKALQCYQYQACETDDWETTLANKFCERLKNELIARLPGYDDAPWGLD